MTDFLFFLEDVLHLQWSSLVVFGVIFYLLIQKSRYLAVAAVGLLLMLLAYRITEFIMSYLQAGQDKAEHDVFLLSTGGALSAVGLGLIVYAFFRLSDGEDPEDGAR